MEDWVGYKFDNTGPPGGEEVCLTSGNPGRRFIVVEEASRGSGGTLSFWIKDQPWKVDMRRVTYGNNGWRLFWSWIENLRVDILWKDFSILRYDQAWKSNCTWFEIECAVTHPSSASWRVVSEFCDSILAFPKEWKGTTMLLPVRGGKSLQSEW